MVLKAVVIADKKKDGKSLKTLLGKCCPKVQTIALATTTEEAVKVLSTCNPDVVFMDIELETWESFDVQTHIHEPHFEVIFTSSQEKYATLAIKRMSLDYLLKPIAPIELQKAMEKVRTQISTSVSEQPIDDLIQSLTAKNKKQEKVCLATTSGVEFITVSDVILCKADGSYTSFFLKNNKTILVSKHLKEHENLLINQQFMRVHNSYLINLKEVKTYVKSDGGYIIMSNEMRVSLSPRKKDELLVAMRRL